MKLKSTLLALMFALPASAGAQAIRQTGVHITEAVIADGAVTTDKIGDGAVTTAKMGPGTLEPITLDKANDRVGIMSASPTSVFTVNKPAGTGPSATEKGALGINWVVGATSLEGGTYSGNPFSVYLQGHDPRTGQNAVYPLVLNPIGGNVGIGNSAPETKLEVTGGTILLDNLQGYQAEDGSGNNGSMVRGEGENIEVGDIDGVFGGNLEFIEGGNTTTPAMVVEPGGNVGIGTTNPDALAHIRATTPVLKIEADNNAQSSLNLEDASDGLLGLFDCDANRDPMCRLGTSSIAGELGIYTADESIAMYVANDGDIGIGITDPDATLEVAGSVHLNSASGNTNIDGRLIVGVTIRPATWAKSTFDTQTPSGLGDTALCTDCSVAYSLCAATGTAVAQWKRTDTSAGCGTNE